MNFSFWGKIALASVIAQFVIFTVLESLVVYFHIEFVGNFILDEFGNGTSQADVIYHLIFILAFGFQVLMCFDALLNKNPTQLIALVIFNLLTLVYAGIQLYQHEVLEDEGTEGAMFIPTNRFSAPEKVKSHFEAKVRPLEYVILAFVLSFSAYLVLLARILYSEMEWDNYKKYTGDMKVRRAFVALSIAQTLIKVDAFFIGAYAVQLIPSQKIGYSHSIYEVIMIFLLGVVLLLTSWVAVSREKKYMLICVINYLVITEIYLVYKLVKVNLRSGRFDPYKYTRRFLTFFLTTNFVLILATLVYCVICFSNMTKGIYVLEVYNNNDDEKDENNSDHDNGDNDKNDSNNEINNENNNGNNNENSNNDSNDNSLKRHSRKLNLIEKQKRISNGRIMLD